MNKIPVLPQKFPYNEMLLRGQRQFETRNWSWSYRGSILLYTSSTNVRSVCQGYGYDPKEYPHQMIVAKAVLTDVRVLTKKEIALAFRQLNPGISNMEVSDYIRYGIMEDRIFPADLGFFFAELTRIKPAEVDYPRGAINMFWLRGSAAKTFLK
ncbi:MAG: hypothetical protein UX01_C0013G0007 [Candidatus Collierbacteria bacterium GW2011_GWB2_45_17]|uniref:ASCH domain-containing protein n=1 Tax=Candidatus Collierbacteria bacterium GW2011_GWB2_45_17 TaxID=1618388 RepID=A0A837IP00_9BACT|nr:MAG: hypothetical protein UW48_C0012G0007 [Microgenomates group bacterium GW2011_GWC1_44_23]KKT94906.1 MAG: hypothetical protein UW96_C0013G0007 [Candidatus Collierbacteria bacterium GW2011_GWA1_45_15]KKT99088.1 MAG: hypothetical protein UX01_C0013G0007 [Candidatus Collierbacteria bacterium GW2011_GWB2_45_17]KKU07632.1 MAG: hypothetical protein UX11_C0012G0007 [Candidatus Collierbacteria bacterium GW2011_GWC2_45_40]HBC44554.1 hypothetical protein [Candidatus Collierbacteria bacterium]